MVNRCKRFGWQAEIDYSVFGCALVNRLASAIAKNVGDLARPNRPFLVQVVFNFLIVGKLADM